MKNSKEGLATAQRKFGKALEELAAMVETAPLAAEIDFGFDSDVNNPILAPAPPRPIDVSLILEM